MLGVRNEMPALFKCGSILLIIIFWIFFSIILFCKLLFSVFCLVRFEILIGPPCDTAVQC